MTNTQSYWIEQLTAVRVPCAPVYTLPQAVTAPQVRARQMVIEVAHPNGQMVRMTGNPIKLSDTYEDTYSSPPLLGQHTDCVLQEVLHKSEEEIARLRAEGVI